MEDHQKKRNLDKSFEIPKWSHPQWIQIIPASNIDEADMQRTESISTVF